MPLLGDLNLRGKKIGDTVHGGHDEELVGSKGFISIFFPDFGDYGVEGTIGHHDEEVKGRQNQYPWFGSSHRSLQYEYK